MSIITQLTVIGTCSIIAGGYIYYLWNKDNNNKAKFLAQNSTVDNAIKTLEKTTLEALNSKKLEIEKATIDKEIITKSKIQEICEDINIR